MTVIVLRRLTEGLTQMRDGCVWIAGIEGNGRGVDPFVRGPRRGGAIRGFSLANP